MQRAAVVYPLKTALQHVEGGLCKLLSRGSAHGGTSQSDSVMESILMFASAHFHRRKTLVIPSMMKKRKDTKWKLLLGSSKRNTYVFYPPTTLSSTRMSNSVSLFPLQPLASLLNVFH